MKMTIEEAYRLAVKKWEYIVNNDDSNIGMYEAIPVLLIFKNGCSYCELFENLYDGCKDCPLSIFKVRYNGVLACDRAKHPYSRWVHHKTRENAQKVLDLIVKTKPF